MRATSAGEDADNSRNFAMRLARGICMRRSSIAIARRCSAVSAIARGILSGGEPGFSHLHIAGNHAIDRVKNYVHVQSHMLTLSRQEVSC